MAKQTHDREDLLRDATGYTRRIELRVPRVDPTVFCGFRPDGALSIYWGQDEVIQFNSSRELRRAFFDNRMLASYHHRLYWLNRSPTARTRLTREALPEQAAAAFLALWEQRCKMLLAALTDGTCDVLGQAPEDSEITGSFTDWLSTYSFPFRLAMHPGAGGSASKSRP